MTDSRARAGEVKMNLEYLVVAERKEVLTKMREICQKNTGTSLQVFPLAKSTSNLSIKTNGL